MPYRRANYLDLCTGGMLVILAMTLSVSATYRKSATADESLHFMGGYTHRFLNDYRLDTEDPPLWQRLSMAAISKNDVKISPDPGWDESFIEYDRHIKWLDDTLFRYNKAEFPNLINRARTPMVLVVGAIVVLTMTIGWKLGGRAAAMIAGTLIALDPLLLGHGSLIKNDASITLIFLAATAATIALMQRITVARCLVWLLAVAIAPAIKFTALLVIPLMAMSLLIRAILPETWNAFGRAIHGRLHRILTAGLLVIAGIAMSWVMIWAAYGFRYSVTPDASQHFDANWFVFHMNARRIITDTGRQPTVEDAKNYPNDCPTNLTLWALSTHMLPESFCIGFLHTRAFSLVRAEFLMGELRDMGWWYYFPMAMLFKTPTASLIAFFIAVTLLCVRRSIGNSIWQDARLRNATTTVVIVLAGYMAAVMSSNLNLGVRHVMPLYPLLYLAIATTFVLFFKSLAAAEARRRCVIAITVLGIGLAAETLSAWPNYIAFFNTPSGGARGGLRLLGDSNLDWGQDLTGVADWQKKHPSEHLYLASFGSVDPEVYGIHCLNLPGGYWDRPSSAVVPPCVIAVSSNHLQGLYLPPSIAENYRRLLKREPREVIGGTIYLYDLPGEPGASGKR